MNCGRHIETGLQFYGDGGVGTGTGTIDGWLAHPKDGVGVSGRAG